ncbi:kinase, pfkB family [Verrucomicrobiia bacterium DG1235]|nr:kinase, pfkB family [Verrucomicrobiae bacterium DG1235]
MAGEMPKVIAFTANLLAETTYDFSSWSVGKTMRATGESFQVGGKGINVSKMLNKLGAENVSLCFPGGEFGPMCEAWLEDAGIELLAFHGGCVTRSGSIIRAEGKEETTFLGLDSVVSEEAIQEAVAELKAIEEPFLFAVCGSVQGWEDARWNVLRDWIQNRGENVSLVIDNYGASLPWFADQHPDLVKFNRDELELLFGEKERAEPTPVLLKKALERYVCNRWVVTNGAEEIWVLDGEGEPQRFEPPKVECVSPTGCGDIVFATVIDCLYNKDGYGLLEAAKLAADYASRSAAMPGIAEFEL